MVDQRPQVAIITDDAGWHGEQLKSSLQHRGFNSRYLSLTECQFALDETSDWIRLPGFEHQYPVGVFVRGIPGGTLEQVIFRLDILHALNAFGILVYNSARAIERTVDKVMTSFLLKHAGLPTPATWIVESEEHARKICEKEFMKGNRLVAKPIFGSQGQGIQLLESVQNTGFIKDDYFTGLYYLQTFIERKQLEWFDIRVFVIDGKARAAMRRHGETWITNRAQGARCEKLLLDDELKQLAEAAVRAVDIDYAGVDLIPDANGQLQIIEVNGVPAWIGLQSITEFNIADCLVEHFVRRISESQVLTVQS